MGSTLTNPDKSNAVPVAAAQAMVLQMELQDGVDDFRERGYVNITDAVAVYGGAWGVYKK